MQCDKYDNIGKGENLRNKNSHKMAMICPNCQTNFYPQMHTQLIGSNSRGMNVFIYYQLCPECKEPVVGVRELKDLLALSIDVQELTLLTKPK